MINLAGTATKAGARTALILLAAGFMMAALGCGGGGGHQGTGGAGGRGGAGAEPGLGGTVGAAGGGAGCSLPSATGLGGATGSGSLVLYTNDFEAPNQAITVDCGNSLDTRGINFLYGTPAFAYDQIYTVEGVAIHDPTGQYSDPTGIAKNYALGMLSTVQDDHLALTFAVTGQKYLNVGFHLSAIDVNGCGGPFGTAVPVMKVSLYDTPTGTFTFASMGTLLAQGTVTGVASPSPWTFTWKYGVVTLDASAVTGSAVTVMFDLIQSGYAAFDNLSVVSSQTSGVVDRNNNGIPDDQEGCAIAP